MITPIPTPVAAAAASAAASTSSTVGVRPPNRPAYPEGSTWISSQPEPSAFSSCGRLPQQPEHGWLVGEHRAGDVVQPLEPEPAPLVGAAQPRRPGRRERLGQVDPPLGGQLHQRGVAHRAGEMQVQVRLGQRGERPCHEQPVRTARAGPISPAASSLPSRVIPSSRSASPRAQDSRKYPGVPNASPGTTATSAWSRMTSASSALLAGRRPRAPCPARPSPTGSSRRPLRAAGRSPRVCR